MLLDDIQTVHHILKNTAVQNVNKPFVYITDLTSTLMFQIKRRIGNYYNSMIRENLDTQSLK
jgi:hypothetical protein